MEKPRIYITRKIPDEVIKPYKQFIDIRMWEKATEPVPRDILLEEIKHVDGLFCLLTEQVDQQCLENASKLKVIANMAVGYDNIDVTSAKDQGIIVTNTPDVLTETTADLAFTLVMATARRVVEASDYIRAGKWKHWSPFMLAGADIHNKTIGIVGMGRIGQAVARRASGFGMEILYHNRSRHKRAEHELHATYADMDKLLEESDFVVSLVPLTEQTEKLFHQETFHKMKDTAIFINVSRGKVVDEQALYEALRTKEIAAAGLDVFANEPIGVDHPLLNLENVICLPHIGSASVDTRIDMMKLCLENIHHVLNGEDPVTPVE
ncbi:2-hydroxyacid dehydrogenase [Lentibacillus sp. Marseille-P4043]|uniref:2-hydroxyacid dehydrogenase n=1 Tax=Lentibacillus sp. Marseille-P4043 TaxID=2040293 RepID=UPI000D0AEA9E|nr:D-glycerate dehydrogenase [Lentibacillus sp. Marseille-P4043]